MTKARVLFVSQKITPFLPEDHMSKIGRFLPQGIQESNKEIRTFMPRFGLVNERRNQLHEVIRLSGMNLIINDIDHPLIIKVASIQSARMQIYFIDNEEYFQRKALFHDEEGNFFEDNDERALFYSKGVIETVKKLGWVPDIIHVHGWISSLVPLYIRVIQKDNPIFSDAKIVTSLYDDGFSEELNPKFIDKLKFDGLKDKDLKHYKKPNYVNLMKSAIDHSDGLIMGSEKINPELEKYAKDSKKPMLDFQSEENYIKAYNEFYDRFLSDD
ncbi:MAG: glycogen/starch synthase [Bacteroidales bacterium]|nr:glycogen/starch synthase [Bacteroidales bacterium]MCF8328247.1 glycogen/starch synthase [Bacteroidales bacterium]